MNYMTEHLLEAIEINKIRKPLYAKLSHNRSKKISNAMIAAERLSLMSSIPLDSISKYWIKRNVPVMVHEFMPMSLIPEFKEQFDNSDGILNIFPNINTKKMEKDLYQVYKTKDYEMLSKLADKFIQEMNTFSKHLCVVRHVLESIRRAAILTQMHIDRAAQNNVRSPEKFCRYLLLSQIKIIHLSKPIDKWAHPIQKDGIPILFQDVPYIPAQIDNY